MLHDEEDCRECFGQRQGLFRVHLHEQLAGFAAGDGLSGSKRFLIQIERIRQEDHLVGIQRLRHEKFLRVAAGSELTCQIRHIGGVNACGHFAHGDLREACTGQAEHPCQPLVCVSVNRKRHVRIVVMDDDAVVLHENDGRSFAGFFFHAAQLIADGEGQIRAGIGIGHPAPRISGSGERLRRDRTAGCGAGRKVGIDAVRVHHEGFQDGVKARFDGRPQVGKAVNMPDISEKRYNRLELKEKLLKNIWNEELMMEKKDYTVAYTEDAISMMDERMILKSDVERVLSDYRENQEAIFDEETKELVTRSRLGNVTFWVRFVETEEGYLVRRAYSHRMNIMKRVGQ